MLGVRGVICVSILAAMPILTVRFVAADAATLLLVPTVFLITLFLAGEVAWERNTYRGVKQLLKNDRRSAAREYRTHMSLFGAFIGFALTMAGFILQPLLYGVYAERAGSRYFVLLILPGFMLLGATAAKRGYLRASGAGGEVSFVLLLQNVLLLVLPCVFGFFSTRHGIKVDALLLTDRYAALYGAGGILVGIDLALFVSWLICSLMQLAFRAPDFFAGRKDRVRDSYQHFSAEGLIPLLILLLLLFDIWRYCHMPLAEEETELAHFLSLGRYAGAALAPMVFAGTVLCLINMRKIYEIPVRIYKGDRDRAYDRLADLVRHGVLVSIPVALLCSALATPLSWVLIGKADVEAAGFLRLQILAVPLVTFAIMLTLLFIKLGGLRAVLIGGGASGIVHLGIVIFASGAGGGINAQIAAHLTGLFLYDTIIGLLLAAVLSYSQDWFSGVFVPFLCAALASLPLYLLASLLTRGIGEILTMILLSMVGLVLYLFLITLFHGVTAQELRRIPGGFLFAGFLGGGRGRRR